MARMQSSKSGFQLKGRDWELFEKFLTYKWGAELNKALDDATGRAAHRILTDIRDRIHNKEYDPNTLSTAIKKGYRSASDSPPLIDTGTMIKKALNVNRDKMLKYKVGAISNIMSPRTKLSMSKLIPILHEGATFTVVKFGKKVTIRIPPRPFLKTVFDDPKTEKMVRKEWNDAITVILKKYGKL